MHKAIQKIMRVFFYWPFRLTTNCSPVPYEPLKQINVNLNKPIAYVTVSSGLGNLMAIERLTERLRLPSPFKTLEIDGYKVPRVAYLHHPSMFSSHASDAGADKIFAKWRKACDESGSDLQIIPISVIWSRNPGYVGKTLHGFGINNHTPSWRKFFKLIFEGRDNCTIVSGLMSMNKIIERFDGQPDMKILSRFASIHFITKARLIVGRPLPDRKLFINDLMKRPAVKRAVAIEMERTGEDYVTVMKRGREIYDVMAADPRYPSLRF